MKTKEELNELKKEVAELNKKLSALPEEELGQVVGGLADDITPKDRDIAMGFDNMDYTRHIGGASESSKPISDVEPFGVSTPSAGLGLNEAPALKPNNLGPTHFVNK